VDACILLGEIDEQFAGNYVDEEAVMQAARERGFSTAAIARRRSR
jgi:hypothetical protein